ncbi:hypothetical protein YC2023_038811 [Brassica napus]
MEMSWGIDCRDVDRKICYDEEQRVKTKRWRRGASRFPPRVMEPEQQKEHPKDDVEEMDTEHGGDTAPTADSDESKVTPKERSKAWKNFKRTEDGNKAKCNHCGQLVTIRSPSGVNTSTMLKHMLRCKKLHPELEVETVAGKRVKQSTLMHQPKKDKDDEAVPSYLQYDKDECRKGLVRMIIKDELPFRVVEKEGFREFICVLQPRFQIPSRRSITRDCFSMFLEEKKKLKVFFQNHKGSVSLTTDTWTSVQNINYMCLAAHFIDENWNLQKKKSLTSAKF